MKKIKSLLVEGEKILHVSHVHEGVFINPGILVAIGLLLGFFLHWLMFAAMLVISAYPIIDALIRYKTTNLVLTNKRVMARYGFFSRDLIQIKLSRIESSHVEDPFVGQMLGYSTVIIRGIGIGAVPIAYIREGGEFVKSLERLTLADEGQTPEPEVKENT